MRSARAVPIWRTATASAIRSRKLPRFLNLAQWRICTRRRFWQPESIDCGDEAMTLPTFVVIGAMKAGTVSLRHYLDEHPDVFLGRGGMLGEPNYFVAEYNWPRGRAWYESLFDGAARPPPSENALRATRWRPPSPGSLSGWQGHSGRTPCVRGARPHRPDAVDVHAPSVSRPGTAPRGGGPARPSLPRAKPVRIPARGVSRLLRCRSQVLVIASEVLRDSPREALNAVFSHLAVDPAAADLEKRHRDHRSIDKPVPRLHDLQWLPRRQLKLHPRWRPDQRTGLARLLTTRPARPGDSAISRELRDRVAERLADDLRHFEDLLGHQIPSHWGWSAPLPT